MARQNIRRCPSCDATWTGASARFCGHCGAALPDAPTAGAAAGAGTGSDLGTTDATSTSRQRLPWVGLGAVALLVVVGVTVALGAGSVEEPADDPGGPAVDLPEPGEVAEEPTADPDGTDPDGVPEPVEVRCGDDDDCVLWRRGFETVLVAVVGEAIVVLDPPVPESGATRSVTVSGLSPETGETRWEQDLDVGEGSPSGPQGLEPLDDDLLVVTAGATLHVLQTDGTLQWSQNLGLQVQGTQVGPEGDVLVALRDQPTTDEAAAADEEPVPPPEGPPEVTIGRLDREDGRERWRTGPVTPLISTASLAIVADDAGGLATLDLATGELTAWTEEAAALLPEDLAELSSRRLDVDGELLRVVDDRDVVTVIDLPSGEVETSVQLDVPPAHQIQLAGELALVVEQVPPDQQDQRFAVQAYRLADPSAPTVSFESASGFALLADATRAGGALTGGHVLRPAPTEAVAIAEPDGDGAQITILELDGATRSVTAVGTDRDVGGACCPTLQPGSDPRWLLVELPTANDATVLLLDTVDGQVVRQLDEPAPRDRLLIGRTIVATGEAATRLWWPDAEVEVFGRPLLLSTQPVPVLRTREGLLALDPAVVEPS